MKEEQRRLRAATRRFRRAEAAREAAKQDVIAAAIDALRAGIEPRDVHADSPFSEAYLRRFTSKAVPPAPPGPKPKPRPKRDEQED